MRRSCRPLLQGLLCQRAAAWGAPALQQLLSSASLPSIPHSNSRPCASSKRHLSTPSAARQQLQVQHWVQELFVGLNVPTTELQNLLQQSTTNNSTVLTWAVSKLDSHAAQDQAQQIKHSLLQLQQQLQAASEAQQLSAGSPLHQLLQGVATQAVQRSLQGAAVEKLPLYAAVRAQLQGGGAAAIAPAQVQQQLLAWADQVQPLAPAQTLCLPDFWDFLAAATPAGSPLAAAPAAQHLQPALELHQQRQQLLLQLAGVDKQQLLQELLSAGVPRAALLPTGSLALQRYVSTQQQLLPVAARWQLLVLYERLLGWSGCALVGSAPAPAQAAAAAALSRVEGTSAAFDSPGAAAAGAALTAVSSQDLLQRLGAPVVSPTQPLLPEQLLEQAQQAARHLQQAAEQVPIELLVNTDKLAEALLVQGGSNSSTEAASSAGAVQGLRQSLQQHRLQAALSGDLGVLTTLRLQELHTLSAADVGAVQALAQQLQAQGPLVLHQVLSGRAAVQQLTLQQQQQLAWQLHKGPAADAAAVVARVLDEAASTHQLQQEQQAAAAVAVGQLGAALQLERVVSGVSTAAPPSPVLLSGQLDARVKDMQCALPAASTTNSSSGAPADSAVATAVRLVLDLASFLATSSSDQAGAAARLPASWRAAADQLQQHLLQLPPGLQPSLKALLAYNPVLDAAPAQQLQQLEVLQHQVEQFLRAVDTQLSTAAAGRATRSSGSASSNPWMELATDGGLSGADLAGLVGMVGVQDAAGVLGRRRRLGGSRRRERGGYEMLANVHHDQAIQAYLTMEADPSTELDLVGAPRPWRDADLWQDDAEFLEGMRPLLDAHLAAAGEEPLQDLEWQLYRDAAVLEHQAGVLSQQVADRKRGLSTFYNSKADEEFLQQRLDKGLRKDHVLFAAGQRYLAAANADKTWRFADKKRLVDRLIEIAAQLDAHPPRKHLGSPFSALFMKDGPPLAPRLKPYGQKQRGRRQPGSKGPAAGAEGASEPGQQSQGRVRSLFGGGLEGDALPAGFGGPP